MSNKNIFNTVKTNKIPKSVFDLSHEVKLSCNMGHLIPVMAMDCVPGDKVTISNEALVRFMPLVSPTMHRFNVTFHSFFVPNRILWDGWEDYITQTKTLGVLPAHPYLSMQPAAGVGIPDLANYLGIPHGGNADQPNLGQVNALSFAAYQCIYNEFYRDENLIPEVPFKLINGSNQANITQLTTLRLRAWEHDYYTSALPFVQKGDPVLLPLTFQDVPILANANVHAVGPVLDNLVGPDVTINLGLPPLAGTELWADTSQLQGLTTINDLRRANALQRFLEKLARGGSRFSEFLQNVFNVNPRDSRLQRPEYIGGSKSPVTISEVLNTTGTVNLPQGNMSGHAASYINSENKSGYFCDEHGYIITIMNVQPTTAYQQGIAKHFLKINNPTEYYLPDFANLGEQEIVNEEVYAYTNNKADVFGYTPRYSEYKFLNSRTCGQMETTLDFWTATRIFAQMPLLNQAFIECDATHRIFAVTNPNEHKLVIMVRNDVTAIRPMPKYGTPSI